MNSPQTEKNENLEQAEQSALQQDQRIGYMQDFFENKLFPAFSEFELLQLTCSERHSESTKNPYNTAIVK